MAMTSCRECGKPISTEAKTCPHCGAAPRPAAVKTNPMAGMAKLFLASMVLLTLLVMCSSGSDEPAKTPPDPAKERRFREEVGALLHIKNNMKNPASFELVSFIRTPADTLCITYRGTNSFNAVVTQRHTINNNTNSASPQDWAQHCQDRAGEDVSKAKYALP